MGPALGLSGLVECFEQVYAAGPAAFDSLRSLVLAVVFLLLIGEARAEGLTRVDPVDVGRLIGLDRPLEVETMRRRMEELALSKRSGELFESLARHHLGREGADGSLFYLDGHLRADHGSARVPKPHLARARRSWESDCAFGDLPPFTTLTARSRQQPNEAEEGQRNHRDVDRWHEANIAISDDVSTR